MISGGSIKFNITKSNSVIIYQDDYDTTQLSLETGDVVEITPFVDEGDAFSVSVRMSGVGDQIWDMAAEKAIITITNRSGVTPGSVTLVDAWITGYKDMVSTLTISPGYPAGSYYTNLRINRYVTYESSQMISSPQINSHTPLVATITNARPTQTGIFILQYTNATKSTFFIGNGFVTY